MSQYNMKKKEKDDKVSDKIFKALVIAVILVFILIILDQPRGSYSMSENKLRTTKSMSEDRRPTDSVPSELKWFDVFKGVSNE